MNYLFATKIGGETDLVFEYRIFPILFFFLSCHRKTLLQIEQNGVEEFQCGAQSNDSIIQHKTKVS